MRRITSIRPGEAFESSFEAYPGPDLLLDVLRTNMTGALRVEAPPSSATFYFREGVPAAAELEPPDVDPGTRLVELMASHAGPFRFLEGTPPPEGSVRTILRPLHLVFEALTRPAARARTERFLEQNLHRRLRLADTYPLGADPFGWGPELERAVGRLAEPVRWVELEAAGISREVVAAMLSSLSLAEMITVEGEDSGARVHPGPEVPSGGPSSGSGLVLDEASHAPASTSDMPSIDITVPGHAEVIEALRAERAEIARFVDPLRGKDYLDLLRVKPDTKPDQIERSRSYLARHLAKGEGAGQDAVREFLDEAYQVLTDPVRGAEYRKLVKNATTQKTLKKRQSFEAGPKLLRVATALAQGRLAHASYLVDWAKALDPELPELEGHRLFLDFCTRPAAQKPEFAHSIRAPMEETVERCPGNASLRLYLVILYVAMTERDRAVSCFSAVTGAESHALYPLAQVAVAALG